MLSASMTAFRNIDQQVPDWFERDIARQVERARWFDPAHGTACCGHNQDSALYDYYRSRASDAANRVDGPDYQAIARIDVIAPVPPTGQNLPDAASTMLQRLDDELARARQSTDAAAIRRFAGLASATLSTFPDSVPATAAAAVRVIDERLRFAADPMIEIIEAVEMLEPGALRDAKLDELQDALNDRLGHLSPILAAGALTGNEADRVDAIDRFFAEAKRVAMLVDDLKDPFSAPSGLLRSISGLKAASGILALDDKGPVAKDALGVINDVAGSVNLPVSPTAPFAGAAGMFTSQIGETRRAWDLVGDVLTGAFSGTVEGMRSAKAASTELEAVLSPRNFGKRMAAGFAEGVASNVPFLRGFVAWLTE